MSTKVGRFEGLQDFAFLLPFVFVILLPIWQRLVLATVGWDAIMLYDWQRIGCALVLMATILLIEISSKSETVFWLGRWNLIIWGLIFCLGILSICVNGKPWWDGLRELADMAILVLGFGTIRFAFCRNHMANWNGAIAMCFIGSASVYLAIFFEVNVDNLFNPLFMRNGVYFPSFSNIRFFSDYQAFILPFVVFGVTVICKGPASKIVGWFLLTFFIMLFFFTGSRVMVLGQIVAHLTLLIGLGRRYWGVFYKHGLAWFGGYMAYIAIAVVIPSYLQDSIVSTQSLLRSDLSQREVLWGLAMRDMISSPLLGIGPGEFSRQLNHVAAAPHNSLLMIGAEWGGAVLCLVVFIVGGFLIKNINTLRYQKVFDGERGEFSVAAWLSFIALLAHSLVANVFVIPTSQLGLVLSASLLPATFCEVEMLSDRASYALKRVWKLVIALVIGAMSLVLLRDIPSLPERNAKYLTCMRPTEFYSPRFWQQGWLIDRCPE
jgi:hypothetical protein